MQDCVVDFEKLLLVEEVQIKTYMSILLSADQYCGKK